MNELRLIQALNGRFQLDPVRYITNNLTTSSGVFIDLRHLVSPANKYIVKKS